MKSPGAVTSFLTEDETEIVRLFNRLFRSFRQQAFESIGARSETIIEQCEHRAQLLNPEFSTGSLDPATAPLVLGLMEDVIKEAPFLKRAKLRNAALTLITDLYDKQYELLETHNAIDKLEQLYYRLRK